MPGIIRFIFLSFGASGLVGFALGYIIVSAVPSVREHIESPFAGGIIGGILLWILTIIVLVLSGG